MTESEVRRRFPCDDLVDGPTLSAWRAVTVEAPRERVWRWVSQVRSAPYSYDWIDNLGRRSPRRLLDLSEPTVGEHFTRAAGLPAGRIVAVDPPHHLTGRLTGVFISYVLLPHDGTRSTRLLMKLVGQVRRPVADLLSVGDLVMARRQLLNWKQLAEADTRIAKAPSSG